MENLKYGLQENKLVHIDDVEKGLACNCICPHCHAPLVAKKGEHNVKHFAHYNLNDCEHGTETALHLMAKNIILQTRKIFVPDAPKTEYDLSKRGKVMMFDKAELEQQLSDTVRGDIVLYRDTSFLNVEIRVTHKIDTNKAIELFNLRIPTIEIDLSCIKDNFSEDLVKKLILSGEKTTLVYYPKCAEICAQWMIGEWKQFKSNRYGTYVQDCPLSRKDAYICDIYGKGGRDECHECNSYCNCKSSDNLLCYGWLGGLNFGEIDKILYLEKEENHLVHYKLLMIDGSIIER
jgi:ssDNA-binding Zn-finger/Zn-ribbon topoisomerase 1